MTKSASRPDLGEAFGQPSYVDCGFLFEVTGVAEGNHRWYIYPITKLGETAEPLIVEFTVNSVNNG